MNPVKAVTNWVRNNPVIAFAVVLFLLAWYYMLVKWHDFIQDYRFLIQVTLTTAMVVLIVEILTTTNPKDVVKDLHGKSKSVAQFFILGVIIAVAFFSNFVVRELEAVFGGIFLTSLLGFVVLVSRIYVNVSSPKDKVSSGEQRVEPILGILDGQKDTYAVYMFGVLTIVLPYGVQIIYPTTQNLTSAITVSTAAVVATMYYLWPSLKNLQERL